MKTIEKMQGKPVSPKYPGSKGLIVFIAYTGAFVPLSTDLYLPALPGMKESFNVPASLLNLTLVFFFIFYALGNLFWGPLSDRYGRKPVMLTGLALYTSASVLCALSGNIYQLIFFRILQACGGGAITSVSGAIVKDVYSGRKRATVLAAVQSMTTLAPIVAPVLGALILSFTGWRGIFLVLMGAGLIASVLAVSFRETAAYRQTGNVFRSLGNPGTVLKNPGFSILLIIFSLTAIPMFAYISTSAYIFVNGFGLTEQNYSFFFAANALFSMMGPLLYIRLSKTVKYQTIITAGFILMGTAGILLTLFGDASPVVFIALLMPATLSIGLIRPPGANLMFEQQQENAGSVSSLINSGFTLMGSMGMLAAALDWADRIRITGMLYTLAASVSVILWLFISSSRFILHFEQKTTEK